MGVLWVQRRDTHMTWDVVLFACGKLGARDTDGFVGSEVVSMNGLGWLIIAWMI
jgi:hypothetical protein